MKLLIWVVFAITAALWTLSAWGVASLIEWSLPLLASGDPTQVEAAMRNWAMPAWMSLWVDPLWWQAAQSFALWCVEGLQAMGPVVSTGVSWLVPLVWTGWGLGMAVMLVLAGGLHVLLNTSAQRAMLPIAAQLLRRRMRG